MKLVNDLCFVLMLAYGTLAVAQDDAWLGVRGVGVAVPGRQRALMMSTKGSKGSKGSMALPANKIIMMCYNRSPWRNCARKCSERTSFGMCVRRVVDKKCEDLVEDLGQMKRAQVTTEIIRKVRQEK